MKNKNKIKEKNYKFTAFEAEEILDALEERYNFLKSIVSESPPIDEKERVSEDVRFSLVEMSMIHDIWEKMK